MLSLQELAELAGCPLDEARRRLDRHPEWEAQKSGFGGRLTKIPPATTRALLADLGLGYTRRKVAVGIEKGGVGKSFISTHLGIYLAARGCRTLLIDLDPQSCATNLLLPEEHDYSALVTTLEIYSAGSKLNYGQAVTPSRFPGLDLVPAKPKLRRLYRELPDLDPLALLDERLVGVEGYDLIIFDLPPMFGGLVAGAYLLSDLIVMPVVPDIWAFESVDLTLADLEEECRRRGRDLPACRILLNRFQAHRAASREALEELQQAYAERLYPFHIRESALVQNAINEGRPVFSGRCHPEIREALAGLAADACPLAKR